MADSSQISQAIASLASAGALEIREDGQRLASLADFQYEVHDQGSRALLHLWSEQRSLARRVVRIVELSSARLLLEVERFGQSKPGRLEFASSAVRTEAKVTREQFSEEFQILLHEQFPDEEIESITTAEDLKYSLSPRYTRAISKSRGARWAVIAAAPGETAAAIDAMFTFALIWLDHSRGRGEGRIAGLRLFFPRGGGELLAHRTAALAPNLRIELYELDESRRRGRLLNAGELGNFATRLTPRREAEALLASAHAEIDLIRALAPNEIAASPVPGLREVALRFRGAEFARWRDGVIYFGLDDQRCVLRSETRGELKSLVRALRTYRHPAAEDMSHPMYRRQAERWMETLVAVDPSRIDARLDPRFLYTQVPAFSAGDRGVIDLLGVTRDRRLAILELKAGEDIHLPLQAADYWLRVRAHQRQGDFQSYGYFPGIELSNAPPLVYLVAPAIRFHPTTGMLIRYLSPEIEFIRVGLAENWRRGLRVALRQ